jgi:chorismate mutase / prephenate dehydratase
MSSNDELSDLRQAIDSLDDQLLKLLNKRADLTIQVGDVKRLISDEVEFYRPDREAKIIRRLLKSNLGPMSPESIATIMREVISTCLSLEQVLRVAYLGPKGTFTHAATNKHFGSAPVVEEVGSIAEIFRYVESGLSDYGVVPIENSVGGAVNQTLDSLKETSNIICGEVLLPVHHALLGLGDGLGEIQKIYAHDQAFQQCQAWLRSHLNGVETVPVSSNAAAAMAVKGLMDPSVAAIASLDAGKIYGLKTLANRIEDEASNTTRFVVLGKQAPGPTGYDRTSIMFGAPNQSGALHGVLSVLAERKISMSRIESRPSKNGIWDYIFFVDLLGHADDPIIKEALEKVEHSTGIYKLLGTYPRGVI